jgi:DNA-binding response OmpR family regulator
MTRKILMCDSDLTFLALTRMVLVQKGFEVHTLTDCSKIVEEAGEIKTDYIMMENSFYGDDYSPMLEELKSDPVTADIPVIVYSTRDSDREKAFKAGAAAFLKKPFDPGELDRLLNVPAGKG